MSKAAKKIIPSGHVLVKDNVLKKNNLTGVSESKSLWAKDLSLPRTAEYTFFAGCGYQHMKYVEGMMNALKSAGKVGLNVGRVTGVSKFFGKMGVDLTGITARLTASKEDPYTPALVSSVNVLRKLGVDVGYLGDDEPCCGSPLYYAGFETDYIDNAYKNYDIFKSAGVKKIIALVPGCASALKNAYATYVKNYDLEVHHILEVIAEKLEQPGSKKPRAREQLRVAYHDPCQLSRYLKITEEPRKIIEHIEGVELADQDPEQSGRWSTCCGGGGLEATHPELSERMGMRRAEQLLKTKPSIILSACPACDLQLSRMVKKLDPSVKVVDLITFLDECLTQ